MFRRHSNARLGLTLRDRDRIAERVVRTRETGLRGSCPGRMRTKARQAAQLLIMLPDAARRSKGRR